MSQNFNIKKLTLSEELPEYPEFKKDVRRAPNRGYRLNFNETCTALKNALRYIPESLHEKIAPEFLKELKTKGRIYGYRYRPKGDIKGLPIDSYKGHCTQAKAIQVMIDNNLDFDIALYPYELVTYGESGQVCQNWMQYRLIKKYLEEMTEHQTLVVISGHPLGLFPSTPDKPRVISTNGLMIGMFDNSESFHKACALGVANYGQMTAGGWMYIGPQGIVHGTYITLLNAGRLYYNVPEDQDLKGMIYVTSGLGGMSGAQAKAVEIAGGIGIIAEVDITRIKDRLNQGWLSKYSDNLEKIALWIKEHKANGDAVSIGYHGNIVDLWQYLYDNNIKIELGSDQTSCHAVYEGGYTPQGIDFNEGRELIKNNPKKFKALVDKSLIKQFELIQKMEKKGMKFWDYGNSFLKAVFDAGAKNISKNGKNTDEGFIFPSYVEDIMGPMCFDYGYGPFRWVCLSGNHSDLQKTDKAAMDCIDPTRRSQDMDNYNWVKMAEQNKLVVGTQARILYADAEGRAQIALKFNNMVKNKKIGPIMIGRDHHDTSGTDSPFRETANIKDGSNICADMAIHCFAGNTARGMTMAVLSNGGGVGIGKSFNGGFGLVLDGTELTDSIIKSAIMWDVMCGVARRNWAVNEHAITVCEEWNNKYQNKGFITIPNKANKNFIANLVKQEEHNE